MGRKKLSKGQSSIEYLLILTAFFASLGVIIPVIDNTMDQFFTVNDTLIAKNVSEKINEYCSIFYFGGNGSIKEFTITPSNEIIIKSDSKNFFISSSQKSFKINCKINSVFEKIIQTKTKFTLIKENNELYLSFN